MKNINSFLYKLRHNNIIIQLELNLNWIQIQFYFLKTINEKCIQNFLVNMIFIFFQT
jgi:hypothetical protein